MTSIKGSSNVVGVIHEPRTGVLTIKFKGGAIYDYQHVTTDQHKALMAAPSAGAWVRENLVLRPMKHPAAKQEVKKK